MRGVGGGERDREEPSESVTRGSRGVQSWVGWEMEVGGVGVECRFVAVRPALKGEGGEQLALAVPRFGHFARTHSPAANDSLELDQIA